MPGDDEIKVIFNRVYVRNDADWFGSGEFYFLASIGGVTVGDQDLIFNAREGHWIDLSESLWSRVIDVSTARQVDIRFEGRDKDLLFDDVLGVVTATLRPDPAWRQRVLRRRTNYYTVEIEVQLSVGNRFGRHGPEEVFTCREHSGSHRCTTVSGTPVRHRLEICPVYTTPSDDDLPPRPTFPPGTQGHNVTPGGVFLNEGSPPNELLNPAVIPILDSWEPAANRAAKFSVTYYYPDTLRLRDNDPRLVWSSSVSQGTTQVQFVTPSGGTAAHGQSVLIHGTGTQEGEVKLDLRFDGSLLASCRALVRRMRQIPVRVNILNATSGRSPRASPRQVLNHLAVANVIFRQIGLELVRDMDATRTDGATATRDSNGLTIDGIFQIRVSPGLTRNVDWSADSGHIRSSAMNHRPNVVNINYIRSAREITHNGAGHRPIGICTDHPANGSGSSITDSGTPSTSWVGPSGVLPDAAAGTVRMDLFAARQRATPANVVAIWIRDFIDPDDADSWGRVIAHEVGHALGLRHRGNTGAGRDNVGHPDEENRMFALEDTFGLDFDLIQAKAAIQSPIVQGP